MNDTHSSHETEESSVYPFFVAHKKMLPIALNNALQLNWNHNSMAKATLHCRHKIVFILTNIRARTRSLWARKTVSSKHWGIEHSIHVPCAMWTFKHIGVCSSRLRSSFFIVCIFWTFENDTRTEFGGFILPKELFTDRLSEFVSFHFESFNCMCTVYSVNDTTALETGDKYKRFSWINVFVSLRASTYQKTVSGIIKFDCDAREIVHIIESENSVFPGIQISFVVVCIVIQFSERLLSTY